MFLGGLVNPSAQGLWGKQLNICFAFLPQKVFLNIARNCSEQLAFQKRALPWG